MAGYCRAFSDENGRSMSRLWDEPLGSRGALSARLARLGRGRLRRVRRALSGPAHGRLRRRAGTLLDALASTLDSLPRASRLAILLGPDLRGFLAEAETWLEVGRLAAAISRARRGDPAGRRPALLFDRIARTEHLATLVPRGRLDPGFPRRSLLFARGRLEAALDDLSALVLGLRLAHPSPDPLDVVLRFREDAEQGRPRDRIDLGALSAPAGPLGIAAPMAAARRGGIRLDASLHRGALALRIAGRGAAFVPAAGSRITAPDLEPEGGGGSTRRAGGARFQSGRGARLVRRATIPGTSILLAPRVESRPRRLRVTRQVPGLERRLARALRLVRIAWPEAYREILLRTRMVVPVHEPGTVSWSLAARPGISFIHVSGKSLVDLADDLLHENSHHRLHDMEEAARLLRPGAGTGEVQAFDSPWRGTRRPLRGILHGAFTFLFRAGLLRRILRASRRHPGLLAADLGSGGPAFLRSELRREIEMVGRALEGLKQASAEGLLAPAGVRLVRQMSIAWRDVRRR
jgi:HEXXH motif-containing protein